jgi:Protein of unknown function (DUF559)
MSGQRNRATERRERQRRIAETATAQGGLVALDQLRSEGVSRRRAAETPEAFQRDRRRDQFLAAAGYRVLRITWNQIHGEREAVLRRISRALDA